ncbi:hypothetical protein NQ317_002492 [Molorchus minor]|uniref:CLIP domain-containing serine protease n=1 Tax=Molorchus minor TaxID=1323400 RepID=A0ABQ9J9I0_9CUCU|nr:hypothetical protein NQ317_002492 [Molorchus minor]
MDMIRLLLRRLRKQVERPQREITTPGGKSDEDYDHRTSPTKKWNAWEHTTTRNRHSDEDNDDTLDPETFRRKTTVYDHTTERNRNKHESHSPSSTPKRRTTTMKNTTPANRDEDRIIFPDSSEESMVDISKATTEQTKSYTRPTERNINRNKKTCKTPDKKLGICTNEDDCQVYQNLKNNLDKTKKNIRDYLSKFRCNSGNSKDYICCETEANDINNSVVSNERSNENAPDSLSKICGRQTASNDRIVGGTLAGLGEFPWLVMLRYPSNNGLIFGCEGSLISSRYVLTAAHCVDEQLLRSKGLGQLRQVVLGEYDTRNETDCIYMEFGKDCADPSKTYGIEKIIPHRSYNDSTTKHDIALIRLNQEVMFTNYISPICLPTKSPSLNGNETFVIAGWGRTDTERQKIPFVQKKNCNDRSPASRKLIDAQICAGLGNGTDSCNGDSGGPLMLNVNVKFEFVTNIIGIISYGYGKCGTGPSVNTFVPYYIDWIEENMR